MVGRRRTDHSFPRFRLRSRFLGVKFITLSFSVSCGRAGRPVGPEAAGVALLWYFYPSAHGSGCSAHAVDGAVLRRLLVQIAVSLTGSSLSRCELCQLVVAVVVVDIVVLICSSQNAGHGNEVSTGRPISIGVDTPSFCRSPLRDSALSYTITRSKPQAPTPYPSIWAAGPGICL